ncbi:MAG: caspase family protein [Pseudomonadota bacterium]
MLTKVLLWLRTLVVTGTLCLAMSGDFLLNSRVNAQEQAERRVALVIGNANYENTRELANPINDASAISFSLKRMGYEVVSGTDLTNAQLKSTVREFATRIVDADVALFFYAGHGVQVYGKNYIIPVDAKLKSEVDLDFEAMDIDLVLRQMMRDAKIKLVFLDACRDNPFVESLTRSMPASRSTAVGRGLARITSAADTMIAYATEPGATAADGKGRHSPFTRALLEHIETPATNLSTIMTRVRGTVYKRTRKRQIPWVNTSLTDEFFLNPESEKPELVAALPADNLNPETGNPPRNPQQAALDPAAGRENTSEPVYLKGRPFQVSDIPLICNECRRKIRSKYANARHQRALALGPDGSTGWATEFKNGRRDLAMKSALERCQRRSSRKCEIYSVNGEVVWERPKPQVPRRPWVKVQSFKQRISSNVVSGFPENIRKVMLGKYLSSRAPKAFAMGPGGSWAYQVNAEDDEEAMRMALEICSFYSEAKTCRVVAFNNDLVDP